MTANPDEGTVVAVRIDGHWIHVVKGSFRINHTFFGTSGFVCEATDGAVYRGRLDDVSIVKVAR